jgi:photosystem II stability/assembly factor-like uncharacterized protein
MRMTRSVLVVALLLLLFPHAWAQSPGVTRWPGLKVISMKLLAPAVGWAFANDSRLYWTTDNGANWADITPPSSPGFDERMSPVFFLDSQRGWALFSRFDKDETDESKYEEPKFDLASTTDAGATWTRMHLALPAPKDYGNPDKMPLGGWGGTVAFLDPLHGWMHITLAGQTMNTFWTFLLVTSDGGQTWSRAPNAPDLKNVEMLLVTPSDGWMLGTSDSGGQELFVTHDGTKSWNEVSVDIPKEVLPATSAVYCGLPTFEDSKHGLLQVSYSGGVGVKSATVLFATDDGGRTWKLDRMVTQEYDSQGYGRPTVVDSAWVFVAVLDHHPTLRMVGAGEKIDASATGAAVSHHSMAGQLSFATPTEGWIIVGDGELRSTTDGGATWTTLTPGPQPH